jgi:RHS repeat-associated protein
VLDNQGHPLPGATISVLNHPEFGQTLSRADGVFDLVVNGGGLLTVRYTRDGSIPAQRQAQVPWQDFTWLPDVLLLPYDPSVTAISLTSSAPIQVARGSVEADADGTRRATLFFAQGTTATMTLPDGSTQPITPTLHVRATEFTVGPGGPQAMPAVLPASSAYTYAADFSVDEAVQARAVQVRFSRTVISYLENFLGFPVGATVPSGYYDAVQGHWVASRNGLVLKILSVSGGTANLDVDGSGQTASPAALAALGITTAECRQLAALYAVGQQLWRVPIDHFTNWDSNEGNLPPGLAGAPGNGPTDGRPLGHACKAPGSVIECQNQTLGEDLGITGTPFSLHYQSDRVPGRDLGLHIPLSGASIPSSLLGITLEIDVAGQQIRQSFAPLPNQSYTFSWNGQDGYGRTLQGPQPVMIGIGYVYDSQYQFAPRFAYFGDGVALSAGQASSSRRRQAASADTGRREYTITRWWDTLSVGTSLKVGTWDARADGLGGWSLNVHHSYDPSTRVLYLGDGTQRSSGDSGLARTISTVAGTGTAGFAGDGGAATQADLNSPFAAAAGPDGSLYIADTINNRVRRVAPDGTITTVAGTGVAGFAGDGALATQALLFNPTGLALGPDGSLYISDTLNERVRRVAPDGTITTVAGTGAAAYGGDGGAASQAQLWEPEGLAVGPDGSLFIADTVNNRVRRVAPDGTIETVAGTGAFGGAGDGGAARSAQLAGPEAVAAGPDGSIYIADTLNNRIRRVDVSGLIATVAGNGQQCNGGGCGDGGAATLAQLWLPGGVAVARDGTLYIADSGDARVRAVTADGTIGATAGGAAGVGGENSPATAIQLGNALNVAVGPDDTLLVADSVNQRVRRVAPPLPGLSLTSVLIPSEDGSQLYLFDSAGRHLRTLDALTNVVLYSFGYDAAGRLISVTDRSGNVTTIQRDVAGNPTAVVSPYGQRTALSLDANGYLSALTDPVSATVVLTSTASGLLTGLRDADGNMHSFSYDPSGRLIKDQAPDGGNTTLSRADDASQTSAYTVKLGTALNATTTYTKTYQVQTAATGAQVRVNTWPDGLQASSRLGADGSSTDAAQDGTITRTTLGPDPRFGMQAPLTTALTVTTPDGLSSSLATTRTVSLSDPQNPLSLTTQSDAATLNGSTSTSTYGAGTHTSIATSAAGRTSTMRFDSLGRLAQTQTPGLTPVQFGYDARGRLATTAQGTRVYTYSYDTQGNLAAFTDPLARTTSFTHDADGRVTAETLSGNRQVGFVYDANGNVHSLTPPGRPAYTFTYDAMNRMRSFTAPDAGHGPATTGYTYTRDGQPAGVTRPDGSTIAYGYDGAGRLSTASIARGTTTFTYNAQTGNVASITAPDGGRLAYGYDGSLLTDITATGAVPGTVHQTYDDNFRVIAQSVDAGAPVAYQYDADGLLTGAGPMTLRYDAHNGLFTGSTLGPLHDAVTYDAFGDVTSYIAMTGTTALYAAQYTPDVLGRIAQRSETIGGATHTYAYSYDAAGRLVGVTQDNATTTTYSYDANGNRLSATGVISTTGTVQGTYDAQDRLTQYGVTTYSYNAAGDLVSKTDTAAHQTTGYVYDALGNLTAVTLPGGKLISYLIDGNNRRIGKKINGVLAQGFLYGANPLSPIAELDGSGNVVSRFIYASNGVVPDYLIRGGATYRIIADRLGSPRLVVNLATGAVAQRMDYDAFGDVIRDTNPGFQPFGFAGGLYDHDTGLVRFGARDYDAQTGRWTARDPLLFLGGQTSLYTYVDNDPVNARDPSGTIIPVLVGILVVGLISGAVSAIVASATPGGPSVCKAFVAGFLGGIAGATVAAIGAIPAVAALTGAAAIAVAIGLGALSGAVSAAVTQAVTNKFAGDSLNKDIGRAAGLGALAGGFFGGALGWSGLTGDLAEKIGATFSSVALGEIIANSVGAVIGGSGIEQFLFTWKQGNR